MNLSNAHCHSYLTSCDIESMDRHFLLSLRLANYTLTQDVILRLGFVQVIAFFLPSIKFDQLILTTKSFLGLTANCPKYFQRSPEFPSWHAKPQLLCQIVESTILFESAWGPTILMLQ